MDAAGESGHPRPDSARRVARHDPALPDVRGDLRFRPERAQAPDHRLTPAGRNEVAMTAVSTPGDSTRATGAPVLAVLRSRTGAGLIVATVLASMVTFLDANVVNV